jgi:hypothetical protein
MPTKKKSFVKESPMETKPKHIPESSLARQDRRSWEAWTDKENHIFFDSLVRHSRNWAQIAADLVTKRQEQVCVFVTTRFDFIAPFAHFLGIMKEIGWDKLFLSCGLPTRFPATLPLDILLHLPMDES